MTTCDWPIVYADCPPAEDSLSEFEGEGTPDTGDGGEGDAGTGGDNTDAGTQADSLSPRGKAEAAAVEFLWNFTGRRFGLCTRSLRLCQQNTSRPSTFVGRGPWTAFATGLRFTCYCDASAACNCGITGPRAVRLPASVSEVLSVTVDGVELDESAWRVDYGNVLIRNEGYWPQTQDLLLPTTAPGTWSIEAKIGTPVPMGGQIAAGVLAEELLKAFSCDASCKLPQRLQTITRQGVSMSFMDAFEGLAEGKTGLWAVDQWVASVNASSRKSGVYSPDTRAAWH